MCGFQRVVKFLDGKEFLIQNNKVIKENDSYVVNGKGLPNANGKFGNLHLQFKIKYPSELPKDTRNKIYSALTGKNLQFKDYPGIQQQEMAQMQQNNKDQNQGHHGHHGHFPGGFFHQFFR